MKDKYFKCIDLFIVTVDRTNPLAIFMFHHLFNLKRKGTECGCSIIGDNKAGDQVCGKEVNTKYK